MPAISRGHIYLGFGQSFAHGTTTVDMDGGLICLGLPPGDDMGAQEDNDDDSAIE